MSLTLNKKDMFLEFKKPERELPDVTPASAGKDSYEASKPLVFFFDHDDSFEVGVYCRIPDGAFIRHVWYRGHEENEYNEMDPPTLYAELPGADHIHNRYIR